MLKGSTYEETKQNLEKDWFTLVKANDPTHTHTHTPGYPPFGSPNPNPNSFRLGGRYGR